MLSLSHDNWMQIITSPRRSIRLKYTKMCAQCASQSGERNTFSDIIGGPEVGTISTEGSLTTSIKSPNTHNLWPNNSTAAYFCL